MEVSQQMIKMQIENKYTLVSKSDNNWARAIINNETSQSFRQSTVYKETIRHNSDPVSIKSFD